MTEKEKIPKKDCKYLYKYFDICMETYTGKECKHFYEKFIKCRKECQTDGN